MGDSDVPQLSVNSKSSVFQPSPLRQSVVADEDEGANMMEDDLDSSVIPDLLALDKEISPPISKRKRPAEDRSLPLSPVQSASFDKDDDEEEEEEEDYGVPSIKRQKTQGMS